LIKVCCIRGCDASAEPGFRTCKDPLHRAFQAAAEEKNTAMFQLHSRLRKAGISQVPMAGATSTLEGEDDESGEEHVQDDNGIQPKHRLKGKLYRNWTHNEQLFVCCCGIIISRATFFGSEGVSGVNVRSYTFNVPIPYLICFQAFLKATFPEDFPGAKPSYIFYDNNCQFLKHLRNCGDHYFDNVGLPVDVFHFKCKHTERDIFCQINCNPARFRELIGPDSKWIFNSSAAEQANVWFGKFQNVVQDMPVIR
jgi:hypothetical protein